MTTFFLKYRPQNFQDIVGQVPIVTTLRNALKNDRPAHAYLFAGSRGTGKTSSARIMAKALNCENLQEGSPCCECKACIDITAGNCVDIVEIDAASHTGVDNIRDLIEKIQFSPTYVKKKVYIIDEVHMLSKGAFNALLKTLEEPPSHAYFILATTELHKLPDTVISRCQTFRFERFTIDQLVQRLSEIAKTESITVDEESLDLMAKKAEGGLRDAIGLLEQIAAETNNNITAKTVRSSLGISSTETLSNFWNTVQANNPKKALEIIQSINSAGLDFRTFGHDMLGFLRSEIHKNLDNPSKLQKLLEGVEHMQEALGRLKVSPMVELPFEIAAIKMCNLNISEASSLKSENKPLSRVPHSDAESSNPGSPVVAEDPNKKPEIKITATLQESEIKETISTEKPTTTNSSDFVLDEDITKKIAKETTPRVEAAKSPTPIEEVENVSVEAAGTLSLRSLTMNMKKIADTSGIPSFAKRSFNLSKPNINGEMITFETDSTFHLDKLKPDNVKIPLQTKINEMFQSKITIEFSLNQSAKADMDKSATVDDFLEF